jgi:hypothetical protein
MGRDAVMQRHLQNGIYAALIAMLFWAGSTLVDLRDRITAAEVRLANLQDAMHHVQTQLTK